MQPDDLVCYCYHVPLRKLLHFARRERPQRASRMSQCLGAGTGCGWCIPFLEKIAADPDGCRLISESPDDYAARRRAYILEKRPKNTFAAADADPASAPEAPVPAPPPSPGAAPASPDGQV
ncbi:MAG: (2Fe-2S)-binding protein [Phycisphaerae bacterium]|nr:MAG: (2Fe-2S)-binding protein [Planctomycetota bacterium]KAB2939562.1 MAG: (2Fe-2S)-binding protein [Phycisphaerae bacterium]MBE7457029.1 (2Fe-2S)-binding protein [Planctomycetia bacterium]MCK6463613.1 (2Fe-2S)-binding protein [Phycisphaerae bacterium]MCL4718281.1 (2Fe-2S)-binding protein [Phycisphaerae bacterium]